MKDRILPGLAAFGLTVELPIDLMKTVRYSCDNALRGLSLMGKMQKIACAAIAMLLLAVTSALGNNVPYCETGIGGTIRIPSHEGCTGVTDGPRLRKGYWVDCKGRKLCKQREGKSEGAIVLKLKKPSDGTEPCASLVPLWETQQCASDSGSGRKWNWVALRSDRIDRSRVKVTYRKCQDNFGDCVPLSRETRQASEVVLAPRETVYLLCSNRGRIEILLCEVQD